MPKVIYLISILAICSLWGIASPVSAQALFPHVLHLDQRELEKQGLILAQEAAELAQIRQFEFALTRARLASRLAPKNEKVWFLLGSLFLQKQELDTAINSFKKAPHSMDIFI